MTVLEANFYDQTPKLLKKLLDELEELTKEVKELRAEVKELKANK